MSMNFQRISPLWETFPGREAQPAAAAKAAEGSVFADVFQSLVNNVRETEDEVATQLFVQVREKALNAYSELNRISL